MSEDISCISCFLAIYTKLWLKALKLGERFSVVARREATGVPIGTSRPSNTATAEKIRSDQSF